MSDTAAAPAPAPEPAPAKKATKAKAAKKPKKPATHPKYSDMIKVSQFVYLTDTADQLC